MNFASNLEQALLLSAIVSVTATAAVAVTGTLMGRHLARRRYPGRNLVDALASLPLFLPPTVVGYYLILLFGRRGPVGQLFGMVGIEFTFTWLGAALAAAVVSFPLMVRAARIAFEAIPHELEDSAALDGAGRRDVFLRIVLPMARNGLVGGVILAFARAVGEFGATLMLAGNIPGRTQTMPLAIYDAFVVGDDQSAMILSLFLTGISVIVVLVGLRLGRNP